MTEVRVVDPEVTLDLRQRVLRPHQTKKQVRAAGDGLPHVAVFDGDRVIACASVRPEAKPDDPRPGDWRLRGMASDPDVRGHGYGGLALTAALDYAREGGARRVWCNARSGAIGFYARHGFTVDGEEFDVPDAGPHFVAWIELS